MAGVFGTSSVAGPLFGGYLTDALSWHWIFFINLPIGLLALIITTYALNLPAPKRGHSIDYLGAATIVAATSSLLLYLNWAGEHFGWTSPQALAFIVGSLLLTIAFIFIELRAEEPIIPMHLFRNKIFSVGNAFGFLIGFALFGGAIYLPLYLQTVHGMSPTESGLAMLPMMAGMFSMSILSGQLLSRTGRYKIYPIIGSEILAIAFVLLDDDDRDANPECGRNAGYGRRQFRHHLRSFARRGDRCGALWRDHDLPPRALPQR